MSSFSKAIKEESKIAAKEVADTLNRVWFGKTKLVHVDKTKNPECNHEFVTVCRGMGWFEEICLNCKAVKNITTIEIDLSTGKEYE